MSDVLSVRSVTVGEARQMTERIRAAALEARDQIDRVWALVEEAKLTNVADVLGFASWTAYVSDVLGETPMMLEVDARRQLVQELSAEGMSTRAIAPIVGVSVAQTKRDVRGGSNEPPESGVLPPRSVTGLDGKSYAITQKAKDTFVIAELPAELLSLSAEEMGVPLLAPRPLSSAASDIDVAVASLMSPDAGLRKIASRAGAVVTLVAGLSPAGREALGKDLLPPVTSTLRVLTELIGELVAVRGFVLLDDVTRLEITELLAESLRCMDDAHRRLVAS